MIITLYYIQYVITVKRNSQQKDKLNDICVSIVLNINKNITHILSGYHV